MSYPKKQVQTVPIAALCLYNIQREKLVLKILSVPKVEENSASLTNVRFYILQSEEAPNTHTNEKRYNIN